MDINAHLIKVYGINSAGLMNKLDSFENVLQEVKPSIFCIQETKLKRSNQIKTKSSQIFTIYELNRKYKGGGGLCVGVHKDLQPVWVAQGDDDLECLAVEVWVEGLFSFISKTSVTYRAFRIIMPIFKKDLNLQNIN